MSGIQGLIGGVLGALDGSPAQLVLGVMVLQGHEVPARISVGGAQVVAIHKLPGGGRIIDAMGPDEGVVSWRGVFIGPDAAVRARSVDLMRRQGIPRVLSFGDYSFTVVIVHFDYDYQDRGAVIAYRIRSEIVTEGLSPYPDAGDRLQLSLLADLASAASNLQIAFASAPASGASASAVASIAAGLGGTSGLISALPLAPAPQQYLPIEQDVLANGTAIQTAIACVDIPGGSNASGDLPIASAAMLAQAAAQTALLAALVSAGGYVNRSGANLAAVAARGFVPIVRA